MHGRYVRRIVDAATGGAGAVIELLVRRLKCPNPACRVVTFAEQIAGLTGPYARYTSLVPEQLASIALALAGRAGARLAGVLLAEHWNTADVDVLASGVDAGGRKLPSNAWTAMRRLGWTVSAPRV